jgi:ATP/ADP translocase
MPNTVPLIDKGSSTPKSKMSIFLTALGGILVMGLIGAFWTMVIVWIASNAQWPDNGWTIVATVGAIVATIDVIVLFIFTYSQKNKKHEFAGFFKEFSENALNQHMFGIRLIAEAIFEMISG